MINLRAIEEADLMLFMRWRNDPKIRKYFREYRELTIVDQAKWFEGLAGDRSRAMFTVEEMATIPAIDATPEHQVGKPIGCCGLTDIDWFQRSAQTSFYIGEVYMDSRASAALETLIEIGFKSYGLHRLWTHIWAFDAEKKAILEDRGFKHEGTLRKEHFYNGSFHDVLWYGLLA